MSNYNPNPVHFDGPYLSKDFLGENYVVEVLFESKKAAQDWLNRHEEAMFDAEEAAAKDPVRRKGLLAKVFGS